MKTSKRMLCFLIVFSLVFASVGFFAYAEEGEKNYYYLDSVSGDDANSGTDINSPVKTIAGLKNLDIKAGTHFLFKNGGEYECAVTLTCNGTKDNPIVISSYGEGDKALLWTNERTDVFRLFDCSYITVSDVHIKAPNGGGIWIDTYTQTSEGIIIEDVLFTDMQNYKVHSRDDFSNGAAAARAAVIVKGLPAKSRYAVNNLTIRNCEVDNCANGFIIWGSWNEQQAPWCEEDEIDPVFNEGLLIEGCYLHDMDAEAVLVGMCKGALVTNCRAINCCQGGAELLEDGRVEYFTAAMWFWGSESSTIQYCEIAGQKNIGDGMAIDFDSHSNNCTYQYIYSHDNVRFMCNCPNYSGQYGNTVRYCLSVNDNKGRSTTAVGACGEHNFSFYNNTVINCGEFQFKNLYDAYIANNIIAPADGGTFAYDMDESRGNVFENNCYYKVMTPLVDIGAMNTVPGFAGDDYNDANSFILSAESPLIGAGAPVKGVEKDFYGNPITSNNIGCYGGTGADVEYDGENIIVKIIRTVLDIIETVIHEISVIFD
ncbi:MAG: right-handed parallel beta-helix repeat-containing protein [Clostridia bacterium]|nr:right-handed parallel beta-helix repeat-containing protein [Clostridia bacterium]MBQ4338246.1 right-handed parallel beta-helix repeat-containing protein [Clostridia bacterium]